jgi:asparagine synthase (glutamine-hydrolysing)
MCGIVGVVGGDPERWRPGLDRAVAALAHRGPDGSGIDLGPFAGLGHTRLAILDSTPAAGQPMVDPATGCVLVFNGEIYNFVELRTELRSKGHGFASTGDTEVLLRAYLEWGTDCLDRLNGMFAFAVSDPRSGHVFAARDRFGEKPLHLVCRDGQVWFASEIKALLAAGAVRPAPDVDYLYRFLSLGDLGHPVATPFLGVEQLPAAHAAVIGGDGSVRRWRWWSLPGTGSPGPAGAAGPEGEELDALLADSVALRLRSDVPVGTSLSSGVDSSLILSLVRSLNPHGEVHAFTASFPGSPADELAGARATAGHLGVAIHPVALSAPDLASDLVPLHVANESPVETPSVFAQYRVMRAAAEAGVTVLLDGQGGDETWAGYPKYQQIALTDELLAGRFTEANRRRHAWRAVHGRPLRPATSRYVGLLGGPRLRSLFDLGLRQGPRWLSAEFRRSVGQVDLLSGIDLPGARLGSVTADAMDRDLDRVMLPRILRYADRDSMAWSREVRLPYLDHRLVALAAATPLAERMAGGWTKEPLRRMLERRDLGSVARQSAKHAFMPPLGEWFADPAMSDRLREGWHQARRAGIVSADRAPESPLVRWRVLSLAIWADQFKVSL